MSLFWLLLALWPLAGVGAAIGFHRALKHERFLPGRYERRTPEPPRLVLIRGLYDQDGPEAA